MALLATDVEAQGTSLDTLLAKSLNHLAASSGHSSVESILAGQARGAAAGNWRRKAAFQPRLYWLDRD